MSSLLKHSVRLLNLKTGGTNMSFLSRITSSVSHLIWGDNSQPIPKRSPEEIFQQTLADFSLNQIDLKECIQRCCQCTREEAFTESDCDLSYTSRELIRLQLENFNLAVDKTNFLTLKQAASLKSAFNGAFSNFVKEKWASVVAKSFYPIPKIENINQRASAAEMWSVQFYSGLDYFCEWDEDPLIAGYVADFQRLLLQAYKAHHHEVKQWKMEACAARSEKDPTGFQSLLQTIDAKEEMRRMGNVITYSEGEKDAMEYVAFFASCITSNFNELGDEMKALKKCIWDGFTIRQFRGMITPQRRHELFVKAFNLT
jgi:hypothetical protein